MQLQDHFDVSHLVSHPAFDHLAIAREVYEEVKRENLFEPEAHDWPDCSALSSRLHFYRVEELRHCARAVVMFQAMMEKVPYFVPAIGSGLLPPTRGRFANSWNDLISQIKDVATKGAAQSAFDDYDAKFYKGFRNPIIHGRTAADIKKVNNMRFPEVYEGMFQGWLAYDYLLAEAFAPEQVHEPSWAIMCRAHKVPETLIPSEFPDLGILEAQFITRHLDGARAATEPKT